MAETEPLKWPCPAVFPYDAAECRSLVVNAGVRDAPAESVPEFCWIVPVFAFGPL